jgi:LacI family transcriptional regulator
LIIDTSGVYGRRILSGLTHYLRSHSPWSICLDPRRRLEASPPHWLTDWHGEGIICRSITPQFVRRLRKLKIPIINLNDSWADLELPSIRSDDDAIGRLAAEHLLERGFRCLAFCGFTGHDWSRKRREGLTAALGQRGKLCGEYESPWDGPHGHPREQEQDAMARWLRTLPRPLGVLACNDVRGQQVLDACQRVNLVVPEEVAVIGVDDDTLLCELCNPPLSSVVPNPERIGYEAAALLDHLMAGGRPAQQEQLVPPLGVLARQCTDAFAIADADIAAAARYIRDHACAGITVQDVLKRVPLSRTMLERGFRKYLGHSPQAQIRSMQLKRVKQLLAETDLPLERIAALSGFHYPEYLSVSFKRTTGQTPGGYRRQARTSRDRLRPVS